MKDSNIQCNRQDIVVKALETKHASYASFHICLHVNADVSQAATDHLLTAEAWPSGALIRRYYVTRK
jgi:hypothetical protein